MLFKFPPAERCGSRDVPQAEAAEPLYAFVPPEVY